VPLRILFADDSVTAQNMGKKILTEAGYEVVAVSNGAAAVKKIAEQKPDIIILDIYMPGYSGLEVCDGTGTRSGAEHRRQAVGGNREVDDRAAHGAGDEYAGRSRSNAATFSRLAGRRRFAFSAIRSADTFTLFSTLPTLWRTLVAISDPVLAGNERWLFLSVMWSWGRVRYPGA